jgi:hypothetical protein
MFYFRPLQPKSGFIPKAGCGETKFLKRLGTGRTKPGNRFQGHFQGQARQLTSPAIGRAILWRRTAISMFTQNKTQNKSLHECVWFCEEPGDWSGAESF